MPALEDERTGRWLHIPQRQSEGGPGGHASRGAHSFLQSVGSTPQSCGLRSRVGSGKNRAHRRVLRRRHSAARLAPFLRWWSPTGIGKGVPEMCGLVVMLGLAGRKADTAILTRMAQRLAHRGPDDSGLYVDQQVGFAFRRLSILDLSPTGHQPMASEDGQLVIVFNGEIYNYVELRDELRAAGFCFRSTSDTEVLLAAYRHWGAECLAKLNGMWAFVIHDRRRGVLFAERATASG
ncbi:MAG: hypothetical protein DMF51_11255 [Acidobacteria bacterium]|nr:MAG: hypothetical protein DMF51_11255 [Acidobacteriota bacterium]